MSQASISTSGPDASFTADIVAALALDIICRPPRKGLALAVRLPPHATAEWPAALAG